MPGFSNNGNVVLIAQVTKAKSNHRVEKSTRLLRNDKFPGNTDVVYLGNIASAIIAALESPDTPEFLEMPGYNEQKWQLKTVSGPLTVTIASDSYWGLGLLTSGYLNIIQLDGPASVVARLVFDLVASASWQPWRLKHSRSARKYLAKVLPEITIESNDGKVHMLEVTTICAAAGTTAHATVTNSVTSDNDLVDATIAVAGSNVNISLAKSSAASSSTSFTGRFTTTKVKV